MEADKGMVARFSPFYTIGVGTWRQSAAQAQWP
jgi:hypothetical protein